MPYFNQKHNPLSQLTPSLDPDLNKDSQNTFTVDSTVVITREITTFVAATLKTRLLPSCIFAQTDFLPKITRSSYPQAPSLCIVLILSSDWLSN